MASVSAAPPPEDAEVSFPGLQGWANDVYGCLEETRDLVIGIERVMRNGVHACADRMNCHDWR